jgi:hypothetical protein
MLEQRFEIKDSPLSRLTRIKTEIEYYHIKACGDNNFSISVQNLSSTDPNFIQLERINRLVVIFEAELQANVATEDVGKNIAVEGEFKTLPNNNIKPLMNDYFIMVYNGVKYVYRVTSVTKNTVEDDAAWLCTYQQVQQLTEDFHKELQRLVVQTFEFRYENIGTTFRTLFRTDELVALEKIRGMYNALGEYYNRTFFDPVYNTYLLKYRTHNINNPLMVDPILLGNSTKGSNDDVIRLTEHNNEWFGHTFYDKTLIKFLTNHDIFQRINGRIYRPTLYIEDDIAVYNHTVFFAIDKRDHRVATYTHHYPMPVNHSTPVQVPILYGKVEIIPVIEPLPGTIFLHHYKLISSIKNFPPDIKPEAVSLGTVDEILDHLVYVISLFVNRRESQIIIPHVLRLAEVAETLIVENIFTEYAFYLYPMIARVLQAVSDDLSEKALNTDI